MFAFRPGEAEPGGRYVWDIGTAGSATMLALAVLPVMAVRGRGAEAEIRGALFQDFAPSAFHLQQIILPLIARASRMSCSTTSPVVRPIDRYASDQIVPFAALAEGTSTFQVPRITEHAETGGWLASVFLGAEVSARQQTLVIRGQGTR